MRGARPRVPRARRGGALLVALVLAGCGASSQARTDTHAASATTKTAPATVADTTRSTPAPGVSPPSAAQLEHGRLVSLARIAGELPQTEARPSARTARFHDEMRALWEGVRASKLAPALPAFFPRGAYMQLKAVEGAGSDWRERLVHDYALDIHAAHALLGAHAASARLLEVDVQGGYAHWVPPGVCYNRDGYWEVPNARVVYRADGAERSFGIASMISWRGVWYVVHFGAVLRPGDEGVVDEPASGRGASAYSGTC